MKGEGKVKKKTKTIKAWADVGSHGNIFFFLSGPVGDKYPGLLHIYQKRVTKDLIPVTITYKYP